MNAQSESMMKAGRDFSGASPTLKCIAIAPTISSAMPVAAGLVSSGNAPACKRSHLARPNLNDHPRRHEEGRPVLLHIGGVPNPGIVPGERRLDYGRGAKSEVHGVLSQSSRHGVAPSKASIPDVPRRARSDPNRVPRDTTAFRV